METENKYSISKICGSECPILKIIGVVAIILALFLVVKTYGAMKENRFIGQDIMPRNTISVTGEGEVFATPDIAKFSFSVVEEAKTVEEAQKTATEKMNAVLAFLEEVDVDKKNIKTTGYNIYPRYEWWTKEVACFAIGCPEPSRERKLVAYEVSQNVSVKLEDIDKAGEVLAGIGSLEVTNVSGLSFEIDEEDELRRESRKQAIEEAKTKAKELAKDLGVSLVRIVNFSSSDMDQYANFARSEMMVMAVGGKGGDGMIAPEIPVGENKIRTNVYITYEIK